MAKLPTIDAYMDKEVFSVRPEMPIQQTVDFLLAHHVTGAPVVDSAGTLLGMITEYDCLKLLSTGDGTAPANGTVRDYMTKGSITVTPEMNIYFCAGIFLANRFRRLPVVKDGKLVGAITRFDLLRALHDHFPRE